MSFSIKNNHVIEINKVLDELNLTSFLSDIDKYNNYYIIIPSIYNIMINNKKINGYSYYIFNMDSNPFLKNGYTFFEDKFMNKLDNKDYVYSYGDIHKEKIIKLVKTIKRFTILECLNYFNSQFNYNLMFFKLKKKIDEEFLSFQDSNNLENYKIGYILVYFPEHNQQMYKLLYDLIAGSNLISTKYIKIK